MQRHAQTHHKNCQPVKTFGFYHWVCQRRKCCQHYRKWMSMAQRVDLTFCQVFPNIQPNTEILPVLIERCGCYHCPKWIDNRLHRAWHLLAGWVQSSPVHHFLLLLCHSTVLLWIVAHGGYQNPRCTCSGRDPRRFRLDYKPYSRLIHMNHSRQRCSKYWYHRPLLFLPQRETTIERSKDYRWYQQKAHRIDHQHSWKVLDVLYSVSIYRYVVARNSYRCILRREVWRRHCVDHAKRR